MGYASKSSATGHYAPVSSCPSVRHHLTAGVTVASAGILAVGLVAAPPDVHGARTEVRTLKRLFRNQSASICRARLPQCSSERIR
jgi:hypothetical protein